MSFRFPDLLFAQERWSNMLWAPQSFFSWYWLGDFFVSVMWTWNLGRKIKWNQPTKISMGSCSLLQPHFSKGSSQLCCCAYLSLGLSEKWAGKKPAPRDLSYPGFGFNAGLGRKMVDNFHSNQLIIPCLHSPTFETWLRGDDEGRWKSEEGSEEVSADATTMLLFIPYYLLQFKEENAKPSVSRVEGEFWDGIWAALHLLR